MARDGQFERWGKQLGAGTRNRSFRRGDAVTRIRRSSESLPMLLLRARETVMSRFRPIVHAAGLTEQQFRVLRALNEMGEMTAVGLANECAILAPSMTRILRKLSDEGLITVRRSDADQRERRIKLSAKGARLLLSLAVPIVWPAMGKITFRLGGAWPV